MTNGVLIPVMVGMAVGIALVLMFGIVSPGLSILYSDEQLTITGEVVCLPHKKTMGGLFGSFETSECAIGFRGQDAKYYGFNTLFSDEKHDWLLDAQGSNELFNVTGIVDPVDKDYARYDIAGVIDINSAVRADDTTSIYEVYARHYGQLSEIIEQTGDKIGGEYSIGIDTGCDDIDQASKGDEKSCILIALNRDLPELSGKIPAYVEGYEVRVYVFESG